MKKLLLILLCLPMIGFGQTLDYKSNDVNFSYPDTYYIYDDGTVEKRVTIE